MLVAGFALPSLWVHAVEYSGNLQVYNLEEEQTGVVVDFRNISFDSKQPQKYGGMVA